MTPTDEMVEAALKAYLGKLFKEAPRTECMRAALEAALSRAERREGVTQPGTKRQHWAVSVAVDGESILTIESNCLSGVENIEAYADDIRHCAHHLIAFIGDPHPASLETEATQGEKAGWKLVPVEPTREMCLAAREWQANYPIKDDADSPVVVWRAMIAAIPSPTSPTMGQSA